MASAEPEEQTLPTEKDRHLQKLKQMTGRSNSIGQIAPFLEKTHDHDTAQKNVEMIRKSDKIKQQMGERPSADVLNTVGKA